MLTLKTPLQLNSIKPLPVHADELGMRIAGNYQLMSVSISPQDLLHITTLQPEVYVGLENENQFLTDNRIQQNNEWKIDVVNQLLNRILLYQTPFFTYQDEVYISTVLTKLGIVNTAEFMEQVKQTNTQSESILALLKSYYENANTLKNETDRIYERFSLEKQEEPEKKGESPKENTLWSEIFERLKTAELNNIICDYRMAVYQPSIKKEFETSMIWQMRQADEIQLAYMKQYIFQGEEINLPEQTNYYEKKRIHQTHITENTVLSQLAAAMLIQLAQEFKYQQYSQKENGGFLWMDFTKAFYGSSTDVIERFEEYQSRNEIRAEEITNCLVEWNKLMQEERDIIQVLEYFNPAAEEDTADVMSEGEVVFTLLENQNMQKQYRETVRILESFSIQEFVQENQKIDKSYLESLFQTQQRLYEFHEEYKKAETKRHEIRIHPMGEDAKGSNIEINRQMYVSYDGNEINYYLQRNMVPPKLPKTTDVNEEMVYLTSKEETTEETAAQSTEDTAEAAGEYKQVFLSEEEYATYLNEVNRRNLEMNRRYYEAEKTVESHKTKQIVLDRESARKSALRALENSQEVLAEIYAKGQAIEPSDSGETERYLSLVDEQTKAFYYQLLYGRQEKAKQPKPLIPELTKEGTEQAQAGTDSTAFEKIMVNQRNQYLLLQEMLEKDLYTFQNYLETEHVQEQEDKSAETEEEQTNEEITIYHSLEKISENQLRQQQIFQTLSDETHRELFTQQIVKIQELIQQLRQMQQKAGTVMHNRIQQSFAVELQDLLAVQNEYLNRMDTVQSNPVLQQSSQTEVWNKITEIQMQYTQKLLQIKQQNSFSPITRVLDRNVIENVSERVEITAGDEMETLVHPAAKEESTEETGRQSIEKPTNIIHENKQLFLSEEEYVTYLNEVNRREREVNHLYYEEGAEEAAQKQQEKVMQMRQVIEQLKKNVAGQNKAASDRTVSEQILINQQDQYFLMQEMLENTLYLLHNDQETEYAQEREEKAAEEEKEQTAEESMLYHSLEQISENQIREQQIFQTLREETHREQFTQQTVKIQELIQQLRQMQQKAGTVMHNKIQKSYVVELQHLAELQKEYLNEVDTVQNNHILQQNSQTEVQDQITEVQMQYTQKLLEMLQQTIISPVTRVHHKSVLETESEQNFAERIKEVQAVLLESQKSLWRFYYNKIKLKTAQESVRTDVPVELSEYIKTEYRKPVINREESFTQFEMVHNQSQVWNEDMVEEIQSSIREHIHAKQNTIETIEQDQQVEQHTIENRQEIVTRTETNITELIQQNLKTQLNEISNQVYQKLERKLESERRRRGY